MLQAVGSSAAGMRVGDTVIPQRAGLGTWTSRANVDAQLVQRVDGRLSPAAGATLLVNPPTAYRMLADFGTMQHGDLIVQNGATSAVGKLVIQLAKK